MAVSSKRNKMIIEIDIERHAQIKLWAKRRNVTLRKYVIMAVDQMLSKERWKEE